MPRAEHTPIALNAVLFVHTRDRDRDRRGVRGLSRVSVALMLAACSNAATTSPGGGMGGTTANGGRSSDPAGAAGMGDAAGGAIAPANAGAPSSVGGSLATGGMSPTAGAGADSSGGSDSGRGGAVGAGGASLGGSGPGGASSAGAPSGSASSGGSTGTACSGLFCEDFESGKIDPAIWDTKTYAGQTVAVESSVVAHGKYAVQFHAKPSTTSYDFIITKNAPSALKQHFFGRAYFNITPKPPNGHTEFLFAGSPGFPNYNYIELSNYDTDWQGTFVHLIVPAGEVKSATGTEESPHPGSAMPLAKWACLEWEFNDTPDQETIWVDGQQVLSAPSISQGGKSSGLVGGFSDFGFGFYAWHPATYVFDLYYDDIVFDTERIGCLNAN